MLWKQLPVCKKFKFCLLQLSGIFFPSNTFYLRLVAGPTDTESESISYSVVSDSATPGTGARQAPLSMEFSRQEYLSNSCSLFQGIFLTHRLNLDLLHCRQIFHQRLSQQGNPHRYRGLTIYCNHFLALQVIFFSFLINFIGVHSWFTVYLTRSS